MDRMEFYEIETLMENMWRRHKDSWEQARTIAYVTAQCQSTKQMDPKDLMRFPWENVEVNTPETQEDREAIRKEMKAWEDIMNKTIN